ncbi:exported hypothetical protein [Gammaproteobacteria bacterium]
MNTKVSAVCVVLFLLCSIVHADLNTGLVAYYPFNGNANDESGNSHHGNVLGAGITLAKDRFGYSDKAYSFNGQDGYINIGNIFSNAISCEFTLSIWVNIKSRNITYPRYFGIFGQQDFFYPPNPTSYVFFIGEAVSAGNGSFGTSAGWSDGSIFESRVAHDVPVDEWHLITQTYDGQFVKQYDNDLLVNTIPAQNKCIGNNNDFLIGKVASYPTFLYATFFSGVADEFRIYNRAISESEIRQLYSQGYASFTLSVSKAGSGTVTSDLGGISCGAICTASFASNASVILTATPATGSSFTGWSGDCTGTGSTCTVSMTAAKNVTAAFSAASGTFNLSISKVGNGTVTSSPEGINCGSGSNCSASFSNGTDVTLTATPDSGYSFSGWLGDFPSFGTCAVSMTAAKNITATFSTGTPPVVSGATPLSAALDMPTPFIITGAGLRSGMAFTIEDCAPETGSGPIPEVAGGTSTQRTFQCVPRLPGYKTLMVKDAHCGNVLYRDLDKKVYVDHPARLGNPTAHGLPQEHGVSLFNGNYFHQVVDMKVPGKGVSFVLSRAYNSFDSSYEASQGGVSNDHPWRFSWDLKLGYVANTENTRLWIQREDGSGQNFFKDTDKKWYPIDQGNREAFAGNTPQSGQSTLFTRSGLRYIFENPDLGGRLLAVRDADDNGLTLSYGSNGKVSTVTDASSRPYSFSYDANNRLSRVTDFTGRFVAYTWEADTSSTGVARERIKTVQDVLGNITTYNYFAQGTGADQLMLLSDIVDARKNKVLTLEYVDTFHGGVTGVTDAMNSHWGFVRCPKQSNGSCGGTSTATQFETTVTPPPVTPPLGKTLARFDTARRFVELLVEGRNNPSRTTLEDAKNLTNNQTFHLANLPLKKQSPLAVAGGYSANYTYTSDNTGNLDNLADEASGKTQLAWQGNFTQQNLYRVTQLTTPTQASHGFSHTQTGNLSSYTPPGLAATQLSYDAAGQITGMVDGRKNASSMTYDTNGYLTRATNPKGQVVQYEYDDKLGRVTRSIDKLGFATRKTWDAAGHLKSVTDAKNGVVSYTYDANGNRSTVTDARGLVTGYAYDEANRLTAVAQSANGTILASTSYTYDALGRITSTTNANHHASTTRYDGFGNVLNRSDALSQITRYEYDEDDRVTKMTDPEGRWTEYGYDRLGRKTTVTTSAGTSRYDYDGDGHVVKLTDLRGNATQYGYDTAGRLVLITDANGKMTRAEYDANDNLVKVTDPNQHTTLYSYDELDQPLTRTDANGQVWSTSYDKNGNVQTVTAPGNLLTTYTYDELNRVTQVDYSDGSKVAYTHDANGNRLTMTDATGTTQYEYDPLNRLAKKTDPQGKMVAYAYDGVGNVTTLGYPGGQTVGYEYDAAERLVKVLDWLGKATSYTLNKSGQVTLATLGNGTRAEMAYDAAGRLTSLLNKKADGSVISSHQLTLDGNGNITNAVVQLPLVPTLPTVDRAFTVDSANRLATLNGTTVQNDAAGRITSLTGDTYSYNLRDQITSITGNQNATYAYNGDGHRVMRTLNGQTTRFVMDAHRGLPEVLAETDSTGTLQRRYVYGYGLLEQIDASNSAHYYHFDPTGSTLALTNAAGVVTDTYAYTPYGETTVSGTTINPFRYIGKLGVMDDGNGMQYMRARYYRPDVARFMSMDALAGSANEPQSLNRYAYVRGNPVMGVDPSGLVATLGCETYGSTCFKAEKWYVDKFAFGIWYIDDKLFGHTYKNMQEDCTHGASTVKEDTCMESFHENSQHVVDVAIYLEDLALDYTPMYNVEYFITYFLYLKQNPHNYTKEQIKDMLVDQVKNSESVKKIMLSAKDKIMALMPKLPKGTKYSFVYNLFRDKIVSKIVDIALEKGETYSLDKASKSFVDYANIGK